MKFRVKRYWQLCDTVHVEAGTRDQAIDLAHEMPFNEYRGDYVLGSLNSDPSADVESLAEKGAS